MPKGRALPPPGYVDMAEALRITGYSRQTIAPAATAGQIPGATRRTPNSPWYFTEAGLREWRGIEAVAS